MIVIWLLEITSIHTKIYKPDWLKYHSNSGK